MGGVVPGAFQADIDETKGLVGDFELKLKDPALTGDRELPELPALRRLRLGPFPEDRKKIVEKNKRRLKQLDRGLLCLMRVPSAPALLDGNDDAPAAIEEPRRMSAEEQKSKWAMLREITQERKAGGEGKPKTDNSEYRKMW